MHLRSKGLWVFGLATLSIISLGLTSYSPSFAAADKIINLSVSPPTFDLTANPGDTLHESIRIENTTQYPQSVSVRTENFVPLGTEGEVNITKQANQYSLIDWIKISPVKATIPAYGSMPFNFTVRVPANAEPGGKYGSVVFSTAASSAKGSAISVSQRVGSLILLRISGQANENAAVKSFRALPGYGNHPNTVGLIALIQNLGNVQVKPTGYLTIDNSFDNQAVTKINFNSRYVLPGASRSYVQTWRHGFAFGHYTADLALVYGLSNKIILAKTSFWLIPWRIIIISVVIIVFLAYLIWRGRKRLGLAVRVILGKE